MQSLPISLYPIKMNILPLRTFSRIETSFCLEVSKWQKVCLVGEPIHSFIPFGSITNTSIWEATAILLAVAKYFTVNIV